MIKNLKTNNKLLKNIRAKLCVGLAVLSLGLTGCDFGWSQSEQEELANTNAVNLDEIEYATLKINTENMTKEQKENETISLAQKDIRVYSIFKLADDNNTEVGIECYEGETGIWSTELQKYVALYDIQPDDIITLNINYLTGEMNYNIEKEKTR